MRVKIFPIYTVRQFERGEMKKQILLIALLLTVSSLIPKSRYENLNFKDRLDILLEMRLSGVAE